jgi:chaperonin GroEL (HSP60 family)
MEEPLRQIAFNAGFEGGVVVERVQGIGEGSCRASTPRQA